MVDAVLVIGARRPQLLQLGFAVPPRRLVGEQVEDGEDGAERSHDEERAAEVPGPELAGDQTARESSDALGEAPEAHRETTARRRYEVAHDREAHRGDGAEADRRQALEHEQGAEAAGARAEEDSDRPDGRTDEQETLAAGAIAPVAPCHGSHRGDEQHGAGHESDRLVGGAE